MRLRFLRATGALAAGIVLVPAQLSLRPTEATAQVVPSPFTFLERRQELGPFTGYLGSQTGRFGYGPSGGVQMGLRYGIELAGPLSLEGALGVVRGQRDIVNPARVVGDQVVGVGDVLLTAADARLRFSFTGERAWHGLSPFVTFGGGVVVDAADAPAEEEDLEAADVFDFGSSFLGTLGLGTRWFMTETLALRADGLFSLWRIHTPPGYSEPARALANVAEKEWLSGLSFSITLLYRW